MRRLDDRDGLDPYDDRYDYRDTCDCTCRDCAHDCVDHVVRHVPAGRGPRTWSYMDRYTTREKVVGYLRLLLFAAVLLGLATACVNYAS